MKRWHETRARANKAKLEQDKNGSSGLSVYRWKHSKRKNPYFVGTELQWLNAG